MAERSVVAVIGRGGAGKDVLADLMTKAMRQNTSAHISVYNAVRLRAAVDPGLRAKIAEVPKGQLYPDNIVKAGLGDSLQYHLGQPGLRTFYLTGGPRTDGQLQWLKKVLTRIKVQLLLVDVQVTPQVAAARRQMRAQEWSAAGKQPRQEDVDEGVAAVREEEWLRYYSSILTKAGELQVPVIQLDTSTFSPEQSCAALVKQLCQRQVLHHEHLVPHVFEVIHDRGKQHVLAAV